VGDLICHPGIVVITENDKIVSVKTDSFTLALSEITDDQLIQLKNDLVLAVSFLRSCSDGLRVISDPSS
jgi:DNA polymerase III sliding clamp (beta) subunit (PCNA family)